MVEFGKTALSLVIQTLSPPNAATHSTARNPHRDAAETNVAATHATARFLHRDAAETISEINRWNSTVGSCIPRGRNQNRNQNRRRRFDNGKNRRSTTGGNRNYWASNRDLMRPCAEVNNFSWRTDNCFADATPGRFRASYKTLHRDKFTVYIMQYLGLL